MVLQSRLNLMWDMNLKTLFFSFETRLLFWYICFYWELLTCQPQGTNVPYYLCCLHGEPCGIVGWPHTELLAFLGLPWRFGGHSRKSQSTQARTSLICTDSRNGCHHIPLRLVSARGCGGEYTTEENELKSGRLLWPCVTWKMLCCRAMNSVCRCCRGCPHLPVLD